MALFLGLASVAHAQDAAAPTVTEVAITSDPGDDDVYHSEFGTQVGGVFYPGEDPTVSVTFSEAVKGSGPLTIDVRLSSGIISVPYAGPGPDTGQLLFTYSFGLVSSDKVSETGIEVVENSLALNGGSIVSQNDSTGAHLAHPGVTVRHHQVNVPVIVFSNMAQAGATEGITVTADDSASLSFRVPERQAGSNVHARSVSYGFRVEAITLDIVEPSPTLDMTVRISNRDNPGEAYTFAGAAASRGRQVFLYQAEGSGPIRQAALLRARGTYDLAIVGDGTGSVRVGATNSGEVDKTDAGDWLVAGPSSDESVPRVRFPAFATRTSYILHAEVLSSPEDGNSYRAGERIELLFTQPPLEQEGTAPPVAELWFGSGRENRREATLVDWFGFGEASHLVYAYTVQSEDRDADGILVGKNPLGLNLDSAYREIIWELPSNLALPAMQQGAGQEVDGSTESECREVLCTEVVVEEGELTSGFVNDHISRGYGLGLDQASWGEELPYPYHNHGGISKATFRYGGRVYAIATILEYEGFIKGTQEPGVHTMEMRFAPGAPETVRDRLALVVDDSADTRYPLGSGIVGQYTDTQLYSWVVESLEFLEERVSVKIVELPVMATFDAGTYDGQEGESFQVRVSLGASFETKTVTLPLVATGENGATADDYSGVPEQLVFAPGETEKTFTVTLSQDDVDDDDEILVLSFGTLPDTVMEGGDHETATVAITDDDTAGVSVSTTGLDLEEGDTDTYTVALDSQPAGDVTVAIGGVAGTELSLDKLSLTFTPADWDTAQTVTVTAGHDDDAVDEAAVTVTHTVSSDADTDYNGVTADSVVVTVHDDEVHVEVEFGQSSYTVDEGQTVTVTVSLDEDPERTVSVPITKTNQAGTSGADYSGVPESVTFNAGEREKTFTFTAAQDSVDDDGESVKLGFGTTLPPGVSAGTVAETTIAITDDDTAGVSVSTTGLEIEEGDSDTYTVALTSEPAGDVAVSIGGVAGTDLSLDKISLTFTPGNWDTAQTVTVTAGHDDDAVDEAAATITHTVSSAADAGYNGVTAGSVVVTVDDDEVPVEVEFAQSSYTVDEGQTVTVTVSLDEDPERTVSVPITKTNQAGTSDADYSGVPSALTFNAGETSKTFTFTAAADDVDDDGESVKLAFGTTLPPGVSAGTVAETTVSITDDDPAVSVTDDNVPSVSVEFAQSSYSLSEGGTVPVKVALSADPERTVTIPLTITNQSGATDSDYSGVPGSITFASGEREKTFLFSAAADDIDEDDESVTLAFGTLPAGMSRGSVAETTVNIRECKGGGIWCGTVDFGVFHQRSDGRKHLGRIYNNQMGELDQIAELDYDLFFYNGITYKVGNIGSRPSPSFWGTPDPPFNIPERASFRFGLSNLDGADALARITMPNEDYLDWTLYVSAEVDGETVEAELPFSEGKFCCDSKWRWHGLDLEKLNLAWEREKLYRLRIVEDPRAEREPAVLGPPLYLEVAAHNGNNATLAWVRPQIRNDGAPPGVSYKIQWKETSGSWDTPADVSEMMYELPPNAVSFKWETLSRKISGLKWGIPYEARVIAVNEAGDSEPSNVVTFPEQPKPSGSLLYPQSATVDGATLILTFDRTLDDNVSLPTSAFTVTVGGEPWPVGAVSVSGSTVTLTLASPWVQEKL